MNESFSRSLCLLREEAGISQRAAAKELDISQALLSHYENGIREPGLNFVTKVCSFYNVSADFLLGRTLERDGTTIDPETLYDVSTERDSVLHGSVMATLAKKLLVNSVSVLFDLLGKVGCKPAIQAASDYLGTAVYKLYRDLYHAAGYNEDFFSVRVRDFQARIPDADMICSESIYTEELAGFTKDKSVYPPMNHDALTREYPGLYQSLLQIFHTTGDRINKKLARDKSQK
ncbi:MAG: helix-turn-helix transcriptional regulator [Oscillospiraceae bacterium]